MELDRYRVKASQLRPSVPFPREVFTSTADIRAQAYVIQQNRAFQALEMGIDPASEGFHIFVVGPPGTGRRTLTQKFVEQHAQTWPTPPDICYVFNFDEPDSPLALIVPTGRGQHLRSEIETLRRMLYEQLPRVFESQDYEEFRRNIQQEFGKASEEKLQALQDRAKALGFVIVATPQGLKPVPLWQGKPITPETLASIPEELRSELARQEQTVGEMVQDFLREQRKLQRELAERLKQREREMVQQFLQPLFAQLEEDFSDQLKAVEWIRSMQRDIMEHLREIFEAVQHIQQHGPRHATFIDRYNVNVLVSHAGRQGAPVVYESNPTYYNLFGRIERRPVEGTFVTDFTMIKPGALHRANGGVLILEVLEVLKYPLVWDTLKRMLQRRELAIEDFGQQFSPIPVATLRPESIPLQIKVILIGPPWVYNLLHAMDEDFPKVFKVKAEFQPTMLANEETVGDVIRFVARVCHEEGLTHLDRDAMEELLVLSSRLAGDAEELSARFSVIADVLREAHYWAKKNGRELVDRELLRQVLEAKRFRDNLIEERVQRAIQRDVLFIDTSGEKIGQINGLAVYQVGGFSFGRPNRITATVAVGQDGIINIERQVKLSGPLHDKGVLIFSGYLKSLFARHKPLSLTASITFEQSYEGIEGDSASLAELLILFSALGAVPIRQGVAVTGSVNQKGQVQPVGGINEKIEGFFDICKARGLTGDQGVVIPRSNLRHLCLHPSVVEAVAEGQFHIWAVATVEEAIEIVMGRPAGQWNEETGAWEPENSVFAQVDARLIEMARARKRFEKAISAEEKEPKEEETDQNQDET